jgi:capsular polysaccharide biosynthesis protein
MKPSGRSHFEVLIAGWVLAVVGMGTGALIAEHGPETYRATAILTVLAVGQSGTVAAPQYLPANPDQLHTSAYAAAVTAPDVLDAAVAVLGRSVTPAQLRRATSARTQPNSPQIRIEVTDHSAYNAARYADAMAASLARFLLSDTAPPGAPPSIQTPVINPAVVPRTALVRPVGRDTFVGGVAGLVLGLIVGAARHETTRRLKIPELADA